MIPAYVETLFGCWWAGLVAVPVNSKLHPKELAYVLADCGARWAFVDAAWHAAIGGGDGGIALDRVVEFGAAEYVGLLQNSPPSDLASCAAADPAWLFYTSGTTGRPKGVVIAHGNLQAMSRCFLACVEAVAPGDALLHPAPLSHGSGLYVLPHVAAGAVNVVPESGGFDADEICRLLDAWDRACFFAAPTMVNRLVTAPALGTARLDRLKCIVYGGGPMYVADAKSAFAALGPRLAQIYGQGESPMTITAMSRALVAEAIARGDDARLGSVGIAQAGMDVRIGDARRPCRARRRNRRSARPRSGGDAGLLDESTRQAGARWPTAGCTPAMSAASTATATSRSRIARRISSSAAARTSIRAKSRKSCCCTLTSPRSPSSVARTPTGARR